MTNPARTMLLWSPRILGLMVSIFLGLFALDALHEGLLAFLLHLAPSLLLLLVVAAALRREWLGCAVFITLAALYGFVAWPRGDWLLVISGPLLAVGLLYLWSWLHHRKLHTRS